MTAFNVVRFKVKPGHEDDFIKAHMQAELDLPGFRHGTVIETGNGGYCFIGEWKSLKHINEAEPKMIAILDTFRDTLEDLGNGLGVTDPVAGEVVLDIES